MRARRRGEREKEGRGEYEYVTPFVVSNLY
jgi:hypothetical protein